MRFYYNIISFTCLTIFLVLTSCSMEPQPIQYGKDACHYCKMNIVDQQHAAEYVTKKGKSFKFDAIECMINELSKKDKNTIAILLVANYSNPGELIDAHKANFLICEAIKSPMGANLTAFKSKKELLDIQKEKGGKVYPWQGLEEQIIKH